MPDGCSVNSLQSLENQMQMNPVFSKRKQSSSSFGSDLTDSCSSSLSSLQQSSLTEREENIYNINTYLTGCYVSGDELQNMLEDGRQHWTTKHGSLDRRHNAQSRFDGNCLTGSLELPESSVNLQSSKVLPIPHSATDHCSASTSSYNMPSNNGRLLRKNGSERSHNRWREKAAQQNVIRAKGSSVQHFCHLPGSFDRTIPISPSDFTARQLGAPAQYIAPPKGRPLDSQISFDCTIAPHPLIACADINNSWAGCEPNRTEFEDELTESGVIDVLDSPEKLAIFRKERYGRQTGSNRTPLPGGHNRDAVDALFRHHEESLNFPVDATPNPQVISSPTSSALFQSNQL